MKDHSKHYYTHIGNSSNRPTSSIAGTSRSISPSNVELELSTFKSHDSGNQNGLNDGSGQSFADFEIDAEDPLTHPTRAPAKSNMYMAFMNMANSILGAGVVGQPFAIKNCGIVGGFMALVLLTAIVDWTIRLIVINFKLTGKTTYQDTVEFAMGKAGKITVLVVNGLFAFGSCVGFCIIVGDSVPHVLKAFFPSYAGYFGRNAIISVFSFLVSYPLSLNRNIAKLSKISMLALISIFMIVLIVMIRAPATANELKGTISVSEYFITPRIFQGISIISFALVCHHNTSFIYFSLKKPSLKRFSNLTHLSCTISMVLCLIAGYTGFLSFKSSTKGNILNNFPSDDKFINFARFCFGLNMVTTFPLEIFVLRDVARDLIYLRSNRQGDGNIVLDTKKHFIITTILVFAAVIISLTTCNLGALLELVGSTTASIIAYILPPLTTLCLVGRKKTFKEKIPYYACIIFGITLMIVSSSQTLFYAYYDKGEKHCEI
ncbi:HCL609Cp [Eremothecium sinecaudum]|uniref:HCL609Cp n=1 Tax=Eremothecium sinecaudum TaxID=45286 RepID=A0A109UYB1_9SACH|nr:HCL609Cp [Eremothecium sinecaudum]AMD19542.1 HCL609Cp [Eremothecium sinecaudum]